jgi:hypothetical protein
MGSPILACILLNRYLPAKEWKYDHPRWMRKESARIQREVLLHAANFLVCNLHVVRCADFNSYIDRHHFGHCLVRTR